MIPSGRDRFNADIAWRFLVMPTSVSAYDGTVMDRHSYNARTHALSKRLRHDEHLPTNANGVCMARRRGLRHVV